MKETPPIESVVRMLIDRFEFHTREMNALTGSSNDGFDFIYYDGKREECRITLEHITGKHTLLETQAWLAERENR